MNRTEKFVEQNILEKPEAPLYHYTDTGGFQGIISNKQIWLTNLLYLNDSEELLHALKIARDYSNSQQDKIKEERELAEQNLEKLAAAIEKLKFQIQSAENDENTAELEKLKEKKEELDINFMMDEERVGSHDSRKEGSAQLEGFGLISAALNRILADPSRLQTSIYVASFSTKSDHLSQWRGYCPQGGYALIFDSAELEKIMETEGFVLRKCVYDVEEASNEIKKLLHGTVNELTRLGYKRYFIGGDYDEMVEEVIQEIASVGSFIKHGGFYEEEEWRLVNIEAVFPEMAEDFPRPGEPNHRTRGTLVAPYIKFDIRDYNFDKFRVMVSPMPNQTTACMSAKILLKEKLSLKPNDEQVICSQIPYRP